MRATSILPSKATWRSYQRSTECAGAKAMKTRTYGTARPRVFGRRAGDGASSTITRPCPSTWMGAIALPLILNRSGLRGMKVRRHPKRPEELQLKIKRIVSNVETSDVGKANAFYHDILGLRLVMDHGWIRTYGSDSKMTVQVSFASEGGSGTPVPDMSIEVDDIETALARVKKAGIPIEYGPESEPWGVRRFYVRDPFGKLINILQHA